MVTTEYISTIVHQSLGTTVFQVLPFWIRRVDACDPRTLVSVFRICSVLLLCSTHCIAKRWPHEEYSVVEAMRFQMMILEMVAPSHTRPSSRVYTVHSLSSRHSGTVWSREEEVGGSILAEHSHHQDRSKRRTTSVVHRHLPRMFEQNWTRAPPSTKLC